MKKQLTIISLVFLLTMSMVITKLQAQKIPTIASTEWLAENMQMPNLVMLDVRSTEGYMAGHIPGSINLPAFPNWYINEAMGGEVPWWELPDKIKLYTTIGNAGISPDTKVVVIASTADSPTEGPAIYGLTKASRVAVTLIYAGIKEVAMLNGGYDKWAAEGRPVSTETELIQPTTYGGKVNDTVFISKEYVENNIGKSLIIDTRGSDSYFGLETDPSTKRAGHIPTAKNLPAPWFWETSKVENGEPTYLIFKNPNEIKEIANTVLGENMDAEIIDYCGVGGYASQVWFVLTQVAGYTNVKFYDGSMQEWTADPDAVVIKYKYE